MQLMRCFKAFMAAVLAFLVGLSSGRVYLPPLEEDDRIGTGAYDFYFDTGAGTFSVAKDGVTLFADAFCEYARDGKTVSSRDYTSFELSQTATDGGREIAVQMRGEGLWDLTEIFTFAPDRDWFAARVTLSSPEGAATNYIAPLVITNKKLQNYKYRWENVLEVPFDNDGWTEFHVRSLDADTRSFEVGALFTPDDGASFVLGSLEHDLWKTAVETAGEGKKLGSLRLYCGATDPRHGTEPHGTVTGESVSSPLMFIGAFDSWKDGLNAFARANTQVQPRRAAVTDTVPFGWNSWGSVQTELTNEIAVGTSEYIKEHLQPVWQSDGAAVYVNLDSYMDNLSADQLKAFVERCHANGQKAGAYCCPFVMWWDDYGMSVNYVPGTDNTVTYQEIRLKKHDGTYYGNEFDGCLPLDVTHPATKLHVKNQIDRLKTMDFDYIKVDFIVQASFEGDFYDKSIQTGIQAYNYGMSYLAEMIGDDVFINLAMSPLFPYQYANGRRLACDSFYQIGNTVHTLNAVTFGFWEKELYDYTDPDHLVVWGKDAGATENEARSRVTGGAIAGTSYLAGDNFVSPAGDAETAFARYEALLANPEIVAVAKTGQIFTPVVTAPYDRAAHIFRLETEDGAYLAVFNFTENKKTYTVDTGLSLYTAKELWTGRQSAGVKYLTVTLAPSDAVLFRVTKQ